MRRSRSPRACCAAGRCLSPTATPTRERGSTLIIAGSREMPVAATLAATAALRAGKLTVATGASVATGHRPGPRRGARRRTLRNRGRRPGRRREGATTCIATPEGDCWCHVGGQAGLGTSGSGDVLAGIIVGLATRGAPLAQAAAWGVALHARAGRALAERLGQIGYLARELPGEIPTLMEKLAH